MIKIIRSFLRKFTRTEVKLIPFNKIRDILYSEIEDIQFAEMLIPEDSHIYMTYVENGRLINEPNHIDGLDGIFYTAIGTPCLHIIYKNGIEKYLVIYQKGAVKNNELCFYSNPYYLFLNHFCYSISKVEFERLQMETKS